MKTNKQNSQEKAWKQNDYINEQVSHHIEQKQKNGNERKVTKPRRPIGRGTDSLMGFLDDKNKEARGEEKNHRNNWKHPRAQESSS